MVAAVPQLTWNGGDIRDTNANAIPAAGGIIYKISRGGTPSRRIKPHAAGETKKGAID